MHPSPRKKDLSGLSPFSLLSVRGREKNANWYNSAIEQDCSH